MKVPALVSTAWLSSNLKLVKVVDASWYLPAMQRDAKAEYAEKRIPGAVFFDVDATDSTSSLPSATQCKVLESYCSAGIVDDYAAPDLSLLNEGYDDRSRSNSVAGSDRSEMGGTMGRINLPQNW